VTDPSAAHSGLRGLLCIDSSITEASTQRAAIEYILPTGRFEWRVQGWFNPVELTLGPGKSVYLLYFLNGAHLSVAVRIRNANGLMRAGLAAKQSDGKFVDRDSPVTVALGEWRKWRLELLRVGTRETTAILHLDEGRRMKEQVRVNWDSTGNEPASLRAGIGFSSRGATATIFVDELWLTEAELTM
jgi:hypothetical protein